MLKRISVCLIALMTTGCTTVMHPTGTVVSYHPVLPAPIYSHTEIHPEVYYFGSRTPIVVYRPHHVYRHPHWSRW
jgi:hypothetical protein